MLFRSLLAPMNITVEQGDTIRIYYTTTRNDLLETYLSAFNLLIDSRTLSVRSVADSANLQWITTNSSVANVTASGSIANITTGTVAAGQPGTAVIRVTNTRSNHTGSINVTVTQRMDIGNTVGVAVPVLTMGDRFVAALRSDGTVWAWGLNHVGQLGDGTSISRSVPTQVQVESLNGERQYLTNVVGIAAGQYHLVMVTGNGEVYTTGYNDVGQLGLGDTTNRRSEERRVGKEGM